MNSLPTLTPKAGESARESRGIGAQINADSNSGSLEMNLQESELAFYLICFALGLAICLVVLVCVSLLQRFQRRRREAAIENESVYAIPSKPTGDPAMLGGDAVIVGRTWNMAAPNPHLSFPTQLPTTRFFKLVSPVSNNPSFMPKRVQNLNAFYRKGGEDALFNSLAVREQKSSKTASSL